MATAQQQPAHALHEQWEPSVRALHAELHRIASREECEDAIQDAIAEALQSGDRRPIANPRGWLISVGRRRVIDAWRHRAGRHNDPAARRRFEPIDEAHLAQQLAFEDIVGLLEDDGDEHATHALAKLSAPQRKVIALHLEGLSHAEIARVLDAGSAKAIEGRLARAWEALRRAFIATEHSNDCSTTRLALNQLQRRRTRPTTDAPTERLEYARVVAHLENCTHCRAYEKRLKGLIVTTPAPSAPLWQQLALRAHELLGLSPASRAAGAAATGAVASGGAAAGTGLLKGAAALCTAALATAGVCAGVIELTDPPAQRAPKDAAGLATAPSAAARAPSPAVAVLRTSSRASSARTRRQSSPSATVTTSRATQTRRDTRAAVAPQPAGAPAGSTAASELEPTGSAGSSAQAAAAPAPAAGGDEFTP